MQLTTRDRIFLGFGVVSVVFAALFVLFGVRGHDWFAILVSATLLINVTFSVRQWYVAKKRKQAQD